MTIVKDVQDSAPPQKPESEDEQKMMKPDFKIGSLTNVYANPQANLGSLAALANYNHEKNDQDMNETGTENMSSLHDSESMWDNYMEKYNSEAYSEDRDVDAARRLLEFGDDYRNFIDSQSDCCSSLSAANIDSMSPPRPRKNLNGVGAQNMSLSSNDNSMKMLRHRRIQEIPEVERRRMSNGEGESSMSSTHASPLKRNLIFLSLQTVSRSFSRNCGRRLWNPSRVFVGDRSKMARDRNPTNLRHPITAITSPAIRTF